MWTFIFIFLSFMVGVFAGAKRMRGEADKLLTAAYKKGFDAGQKEVTEGGYREPAALPPAPPPNPFLEHLTRMSRMVASAGVWMDEDNRADWERRTRR